MIPFSGRRIALIGGAGFIGHNLAMALTERGADVLVIDSLAVNNLLSFLSKPQDAPGIRLYTQIIGQRLDILNRIKVPLCVVDARDYVHLGFKLSEYKPDVIVHLAAVSHAGKSNKDPYSTFDHSFRTLENALDCAKTLGCHFVYFSSSMVYGNFPDGHVTEDTPPDPLGIYAALKFGGEKLVIGYNQVFEFPYTIIRPSALYGQRCVSRRVGQIFIEHTLRGAPVTINGDGSERLDFTYIKDLAQGVLKVIENENSHNQIFNLTYGDSRSLNDMLGVLRQEFPDVKVEYKPKDKLMPDRGTLSVDKARDLLGYAPQYPLERGYMEYINWYKDLYADMMAADQTRAAMLNKYAALVANAG